MIVRVASSFAIRNDSSSLSRCWIASRSRGVTWLMGLSGCCASVTTALYSLASSGCQAEAWAAPGASSQDPWLADSGIAKLAVTGPRCNQDAGSKTRGGGGSGENSRASSTGGKRVSCCAQPAPACRQISAAATSNVTNPSRRNPNGAIGQPAGRLKNIIDAGPRNGERSNGSSHGPSKKSPHPTRPFDCD